MRLFSPAKINLSLTILGKRADGYHDIDSVIQTVSFGDFVTIEPAAETTIQCDNPAVPIGPLEKENLCFQVLELVSNFTKKDCFAKISLEKNIPLQGGLGGGSSNAATVLRAVNELFDLSLKLQQLIEIGASVSSDIPALLLGGTVHARGRGERVAPLPAFPHLWFVIVDTEIKISSTDAYAWWDEQLYPSNPVTYSPSMQWVQQTQNDFETILFKKYPALQATCNELRNSSAVASRVTGSGGCVYGIFTDELSAKKAAAEFPIAYVATPYDARRSS